MMKLVVLAVLVAVAAAAPGGLYGGYPGIAVAPAPLAVAHAAPIAVAHAPIATSYANVNLISRPALAVHAVQPIAVKTFAAPVPVAVGHGIGLGGLAHY